MNAKVKYPLMRHQLQTSLLELSDIEYQSDIWVKGDRIIMRHYVGFDITTEVFLDNIIWDGGTDLIGICLRNRQELDACLNVVRILENFIKSKPSNLPDEAYIQDADWLPVIAAARNALRVLNSGDI